MQTVCQGGAGLPRKAILTAWRVDISNTTDFSARRVPRRAIERDGDQYPFVWLYAPPAPQVKNQNASVGTEGDFGPGTLNISKETR